MKIEDICQNEKTYGEDFKAHLLTQYQLYVTELDKLNDRRQKTNDFFLALNTALIAFLGVMIRFGEQDLGLFLILASLAGAAICTLWYSLIRNYSLVSKARFEILHIMEEKLPVHLFKREWNLLTKGKKKDRYTPITHVEQNVPWIFIVFYILMVFSYQTAFVIPFL